MTRGGPAAGLCVCVVGDVLLDVVVKLDGPIALDTDAFGRTVVGAGGQAANVAAWIVALGGRAVLVGKLASDPAARLIRQELRRRGVTVHSPQPRPGPTPGSSPSEGLPGGPSGDDPSGEGRTGTVVSVATPDGRRTMLTDRGVAADLRPDELDPAWFERCGWLHVSAYSLARSTLREATLAITARLRGVPVSVDYASVAVIQALGVARFRELVVALRPAVTFANEREAELVGPLPFPSAPAPSPSPRPAVAVAAAGGCVRVVKLGARGCLVDGRRYRGRPVEAVDSTGAGDAFAAGFLLGGPPLALQAAERCVATVGAMP